MMRSFLAVLITVLALYGCGNSDSVDGDKLFNQGEYQLAIEAYDEYLSSQPKHIKSLYNRGRAYEELGNYKKAIEDYSAVLDIDKKNVQANLSIGIDAFRNNDPDKALYHFGQSVSADPDNFKALILRGRAFHRLGNFESARKDFDAAIRINKEAGEAYFYRGIIYLESNKRKACVDFRKASNLGVKDADKAQKRYCN